MRMHQIMPMNVWVSINDVEVRFDEATSLVCIREADSPDDVVTLAWNQWITLRTFSFITEALPILQEDIAAWTPTRTPQAEPL